MMTPNEARARAVFALGILSARLRTDVLDDNAIGLRYGFELTRPIQLGDYSAPRDKVFAAFQSLADGAAAPAALEIDGPDGAVSVEVSLDGDAGVISLPKARFRFEDARMLASDPGARLEVLEAAFLRQPVSSADRAALQAAVASKTFDFDAFFGVVITLGTSPEAFVGKFDEAAKAGRMSRTDFLPDDARHWDHLVGRYDGSATLDDYAANVLVPERVALMQADGDAIRRLSLTFATPTLVAKGLLADLKHDERLAAIASLAELVDPFAQVAALQFCAEHLDPETEELGIQALAGLFDDIDRLETYTRVYGAVFVIATAALARHEVLGRTPPFWRRLATHAHAALVVRASANVKGTQQELMSWATAQSGSAYLTSVLRDFAIDPRWRPDWIESTFVVADIWGRANAIVTGLGETAPRAWSERIETAKAWVEERHALSSAHFPAPLEGMRRDLAKLDDMGPLAERYRALQSNPTIEAFVRLTPLVHAFMPPPEFEGPAIEVTRGLLRPLRTEEAPFAPMALALAAHTAALLQSKSLAAAVSETTVALVRRRSDIVGVGDAVCRLLEANAALTDRMEADASLGLHFEVLALAFASQSDLGHLRGFLLALQSIDPILAPRLGRALAVADLGANRAGAAA